MARILFTTNAAAGHFGPLVPTARALVAGGHEVRVGCPEGFAATVRAAGFDVAACATRDADVDVDADADADADVDVDVDVAVAPPPAADDRHRRLAWAVRESWPTDARPWVHALHRDAASWSPDLIVVEPVEHAGRVVGSALGIPVVEHGWGFSLPAGWTAAGAEAIPDLYAEFGAAPVPVRLAVDLGTPGIQAADAADVPRYRHRPWSHAGARIPDKQDRPRVLVTLGTYDNPHASARLRTAVAAAADTGAEVIAVLGNADRVLGEVPDGVCVLEWVDLPAVAVTCDAVLHHGGAGTSWATLVAGRPAVVLPQMGDQFRNAALLVQAGAAVSLEPGEADRERLGGAIRVALEDDALRSAAERVAADNAALPDVPQLAADLARLVEPGAG